MLRLIGSSVTSETPKSIIGAPTLSAKFSYGKDENSSVTAFLNVCRRYAISPLALKLVLNSSLKLKGLLVVKLFCDSSLVIWLGGTKKALNTSGTVSLFMLVVWSSLLVHVVLQSRSVISLVTCREGSCYTYRESSSTIWM